MGAAVGLDDAEAEALLDSLDMADDTDGPTAGTQLGQRVDGEGKRLGVEGAEALVDEQAVAGAATVKTTAMAESAIGGPERTPLMELFDEASEARLGTM